MGHTELAAFQKIVLRDLALQVELRELTDEADFITTLIRDAQAYDLILQPHEIQAALQAARRAWIERWIT